MVVVGFDQRAAPIEEVAEQACGAAGVVEGGVPGPVGQAGGGAHSISDRRAQGIAWPAARMVHSPAVAWKGMSTARRANSARRCMASKGQLWATTTRPASSSARCAGDLVERGGAADVGGADAVDGLGAEVALRVEQGAPLVGGGAVGVEVDDGDFGDAVAVAGE